MARPLVVLISMSTVFGCSRRNDKLTALGEFI